MLIEALTPLRVKADGKRFALEPGQVVDLSPGCAARLLERAHGKVRAVPPPETPATPLQAGWLAVWRELATITSGMTGDDPRLPPVMEALDLCDDAFRRGSWVAFRHAAAQVRSAVAGRNRRAEP